jgi:transposase
MKGSIYIIRNTVNEKVYIGQTKYPIKKRFKEHLKASKDKTKNAKFQLVLREYGVDKFYVELLEENIELNETDKKEKHYIKKYDSYINGYNSTIGGENKLAHNDDLNEIIGLYKQGSTLTQIAKKYHICAKSISATLKDKNIPIRDWNKEQSNDLINKENLYKLHYIQNKSLQDIAKFLGLSRPAIANWFNKYNLKVRSCSTIARNKVNKEDLKRMYIDEKVLLMDISKHYEVTVQFILDKLDEFNLHMNRSERRNFLNQDKQKKEKTLIMKLYNEGYSKKEIAKEMNVHVETIYRKFKKYEINKAYL